MGFSISFSSATRFPFGGPATGTSAATTTTTTTTLRVLLALAPVALPTAYLLFLKRSLAKRTVASARISPPDPLVAPAPSTSTSTSQTADDDDDDEIVLPSHVRGAPELFVVAREKVVSEVVPIAVLRPEFVRGDGDADGGELSGLLEAYLSATMQAFAWTPQALLMARMGGSLRDLEAYRRTFDEGYLSECGFEEGDRVCGVYVVRGRRGGRVVLDLSPPSGWKGPVVTGALNVGFDREGEDGVRFVNETIMWRRKEGEKPTLLEGKVGRWLHTLMASWLVVKGIEAVTIGKVKSS
ncbi:hypothetical protein K449DRAFT_429365 [Hypoxylon sp. EC38]|nr:hypothetical protein K449DRAFT_429365 [Hypoxylon sp. EC38]